MIPPVYSLLKASTEVTAIVVDRIGEHGVIFANELRPYLTWQIVSGIGEVILDKGRSPHDRIQVQVDCWHKTSAGVVDLAEAVRSAIESDAYYSGTVADERDAETLLYRLSLQFDFLKEY
jgi:hypothetical protein